MKLNVKKILVVDNDPLAGEKIKSLIDTSDFSIHTSDNHERVTQLLDQSTYELTLIFVRRTNDLGQKALSHIKENEVDTSCIILSEETDIELVRESLTQGAHDFLQIPYLQTQLRDSIEKAFKRKVAADKIKEEVEKIRVSEKIHKYLVNTSPDILYMLDTDGQFTFVNERIESLLGYEPLELIGTHYSEIVHHEDIEKARYVFNERRLGDRASKNIELRLKCRASTSPRVFDTRTLPIEFSSTGIYESKEQGSSAYIGTYGVARDITDRKLAEDTINFQTYHDPLTKLPNRTLLHDRLSLAISHAKREDEMIAVMFLDLDRFKNINDSLGHMIGDELLQQVSKRLRSCIREGDTLARSGGDEFILMLPKISVHKRDVKNIAKKVTESLKNPFIIEGHELYVSASIGISIFPRDGNNMDTLVKNADIAMYDVKSKGKNNFQFYYDEMTAPYFKNLSLETGIRKALENNEFSLAYQPQISLRSGEVTGVEALLRWDHPEHGNISPTEFIPFAEETGLIIELGQWVIDSALKQLRIWHQAGLPHIRLSVNMSTQQLADDDIVNVVKDTLEKHGLEGKHLEIEITENSIMEDMESVIHKLKEFHELGITIAIDDFGTGYSSLSYLHKLPIHTLKIDKVFIKDNQFSKGEHSIVNTIIAMAKGLELNVIAEGVETKKQLASLLSLDCAEVQGFFFGKAVKPRRIEELLGKDPFVLPEVNSANRFAH